MAAAGRGGTRGSRVRGFRSVLAFARNLASQASCCASGRLSGWVEGSCCGGDPFGTSFAFGGGVYTLDNGGRGVSACTPSGNAHGSAVRVNMLLRTQPVFVWPPVTAGDRIIKVTVRGQAGRPENACRFGRYAKLRDNTNRYSAEKYLESFWTTRKGKSTRKPVSS